MTARHPTGKSTWQPGMETTADLPAGAGISSSTLPVVAPRQRPGSGENLGAWPATAATRSPTLRRVEEILPCLSGKHPPGQANLE